MSKYVLLTGATGLVGRYLLRDLLQNGYRLALVVRGGRKQSAAQRIETILQMWEVQLGRQLPRPVCLDGDVTAPQLGLSATDCRWIQEHCDTAIHNAAVLTFHGSDRSGEPWRTNLNGTQHLLELCRSTGIRKLHYVSTAYVCGRQEGLVLEDQLDVGQTFRNDYEQSKFLAEQAVRGASFLDQLTVYRPAVIAGDSITGYTNTYHGIYLYLRLMSLLVRNIEPDQHGVRHVSQMRINLRGDELRNVVPIDWVSQVFCRIFTNPAAHGQTYHLAPQVPITPREIIDATKTYLNSTDITFCGYDTVDPTTLSDFERSAYGSMSIYESYDSTDPRFDTTNLAKFAGDLECPRIDEAMLHRYLRYGESDRWGKRREPNAETCFETGDYLRGLVSESQGTGSKWSDSPIWIGLDLRGPGGGQWKMRIERDHVCQLELGLPADPRLVLVARAERFARLARGEEAATLENIQDCLTELGGRRAEAAMELPWQPLAQALFGAGARASLLRTKDCARVGAVDPLVTGKA